MNYTTTTTHGSVTVQRIKPLSDEIVYLTFSSVIPHYKTSYSDILLTIYTQLALAGTKHRSQDENTAYLRKNGINITISHKRGVLHYTCTVHKTKLPAALTFIDEILFENTIPVKQFTEAITVQKEKNRELKDDARYVAGTAFINTLYNTRSLEYCETPSTQKKLLTDMTQKNVHDLTRDIRKGTWTISFTGSKAVEKKVVEFAQKLSKESSLVKRSYTAHTAAQTSSKTYTTVPGKTNVEMRIGNTLPISPLDDDYAAFIFGLMVLGKVGGFAGRLMSTVREKEGLTYGIYATTEHYSLKTTGHWFIYTFFTAKDLARGIQSTLREIKHIVESGVTSKEVEIFKEIISNQFLLAHDSSSKRLNYYHQNLLSGYTEEFLLSQREVLLTVQKKAINAALKKYIDPRKLIFSGAGPVTKDGVGITK